MRIRGFSWCMLYGRYVFPERRGIASDAPTVQPRVVVAQGLARRWSVDIPRRVQTSQCDCSLGGGRDCAPTRYVWHVCGREITYPSGTDTPSRASDQLQGVYGRYWD